MRAAQLTGHGGPEMLQVSNDVAVPEPGWRDVLIAVAACGMNNTDINTRVGWYSGSVSAPTGEGGFAEYVCVPAANAYAIESDLTDAELATFPCSSATAMHMLRRIGLRSDQSIAVTGASGGVGSALVQLAKRSGARVVAVASQSKLDLVRELGADEVIAREPIDRSGELVGTAVAANGGNFDAVADVVGGSAFPRWLQALARGGRYVASGAIGGPSVQLDLRTLYLRDLELYGATVYLPQVFDGLVDVIEQGEIRPLLAGTYRLEAIHRAQEDFLAKKHVGNLVITL